jgi:hypothetical protein
VFHFTIKFSNTKNKSANKEYIHAALFFFKSQTLAQTTKQYRSMVEVNVAATPSNTE